MSETDLQREIDGLRRTMDYLQSQLERANQALDTVSSVTFNAINVGTANGASTGDVRLSGSLVLTTNTNKLFGRNSAGSADVPLLELNNANEMLLLGGGGTNAFKFMNNAQNIILVQITDLGAVSLVGAFGANGAAAQGKVVSGGAVVPGAGAFGASSAALFANLVTLVTNIRTALVNNGIMS